MSVASNELVDDIMRQWPATIHVFLKHKLHCVGCPIACFHTVDDACREHDVDVVGFLAELNAVIDRSPAPQSSHIRAQWPRSEGN